MGGVGRLMANAILNFHFDYLNPSLIQFQKNDLYRENRQLGDSDVIIMITLHGTVGWLVIWCWKKGKSSFFFLVFFGRTNKVQRCLLSWSVGPSLEKTKLSSGFNHKQLNINSVPKKNLRDEVPYNHRAHHFAWFSPILSWPRMFSKRVFYDFQPSL